MDNSAEQIQIQIQKRSYTMTTMTAATMTLLTFAAPERYCCFLLQRYTRASDFRQQQHRRLRTFQSQQNDENPASASASESASAAYKRYHHALAHMNYARLKAPMDDPSMTEFRLAMDPINSLAKATPGFVWSLNDDDAASRNQVPMLRDDPLLMPQLSLWTNVDALQHFAFKSGHAMYYKRKREWFTAPVVEPPFAVCWWFAIHENQQHPQYPTLKEAFDRCAHLSQHGPSSHAFNFATAKEYPIPKD
jgi:hypothetical protein